MKRINSWISTNNDVKENKGEKKQKEKIAD